MFFLSLFHCSKISIKIPFRSCVKHVSFYLLSKKSLAYELMMLSFQIKLNIGASVKLIFRGREADLLAFNDSSGFNDLSSEFYSKLERSQLKVLN